MQIESYGDVGIYSYRRPIGHTKSGARHRGETPMVTEWGYVRRVGDAWAIGSAKPGFVSRKAVLDAAAKACGVSPEDLESRRALNLEQEYARAYERDKR